MAKSTTKNKGGRPVGSKTLFSISDFVSKKDVDEFLKHVKANYKTSDKLAVWYGDHLLGKAVQPMEHTGEDGGPIKITGVEIVVRK